MIKAVSYSCCVRV